MEAADLTQAIAATRAQIKVYEDAIAARVDPTIERYALDTGQSQQTVRFQPLKELTATLDALYNRLSTLCNRQKGTGVVMVEPAW